MLSKKGLEHLAELSRLGLKKGEEKLLRDLEKILDHFKELEEIDTSAVEPMTGGTFLTNEFRDEEKASRLSRDLAIEQFPEKKDGFLKVPPVFE